MRNFFLTSCPVAIWCIAVIELVLLTLMYRKYSSSKMPIFLCMALLTTGLFMDCLGICLGSVLSGSLLIIVNRIRFICHGVLIPLLFPICAYALGLNKKWTKSVWVLTIILMIAGLAESMFTVLEPATIAGVTRLKASASTPAWATAISNILSFGTVIPLMITGIIVWIKQKTTLLFLSGFFMFAFSALGPATGNTDLIFYISMFGEVLLVLFLYLYALRFEK